MSKMYNIYLYIFIYIYLFILICTREKVEPWSFFFLKFSRESITVPQKQHKVVS